MLSWGCHNFNSKSKFDLIWSIEMKSSDSTNMFFILYHRLHVCIWYAGWRNSNCGCTVPFCHRVTLFVLINVFLIDWWSTINFKINNLNVISPVWWLYQTYTFDYIVWQWPSLNESLKLKLNLIMTLQWKVELYCEFRESWPYLKEIPKLNAHCCTL